LRKDPIVADVFASGEPNYVSPSLRDGNIFLRVVYPYRPDRNGQINCQSCHEVASNDVIGAVDFKVDMSHYLSDSLTYLYLFLAAFLLVMLAIVLTFFRIIDRHIKDPLEDLIRKTKDAYASHISIDTERYESMELAYVADKVNEFTGDILKAQRELEGKNRQLVALNTEIEATQKEIVNTLANVIEGRSKDTANHVQRVTEYSLLLAQRLGLDDKHCQLLHDAAAMHDLGKVGVEDAILKKPGRLTEDEYRQMTKHSEMGYEILKYSERPLLQTAALIAHQHHEKWDGTGYPQGLSGNDIHIFGRITAVADVFDALSCARCYKEPWPLGKVFAFFEEQKGKAFDPELVDILLNSRNEIEEIMRKYGQAATDQAAQTAT
jgi:response regulator RpfG family c-di-GMP phosphodiesterase